MHHGDMQELMTAFEVDHPASNNLMFDLLKLIENRTGSTSCARCRIWTFRCSWYKPKVELGRTGFRRPYPHFHGWNVAG